LSQGSN